MGNSTSDLTISNVCIILVCMKMGDCHHLLQVGVVQDFFRVGKILQVEITVTTDKNHQCKTEMEKQIHLCYSSLAVQIFWLYTRKIA